MTQNSLFVFCIDIESEMLMQMVEQEKGAGYEPIWEYRLKHCDNAEAAGKAGQTGYSCKWYREGGFLDCCLKVLVDTTQPRKRAISIH